MIEYQTPNDAFKLSLISLEEPNYGRMLYEVKIEQDGIDVTKKFKPHWQKIYHKLDQYQFCTADSMYIYLPFESGGILYDLEGEQIMDLTPYPKPGLNQYDRFIGNRFSRNQLVVVFNYFIQMVNLETGQIKNIVAEEDELFDWIEFIDDNTIEATVNIVKKQGNVLNKTAKKKTRYSNV